MKTLKEMIAIMQAALDGKKIECKHVEDEDDPWREMVVETSYWNWCSCDYRVKTEKPNIFENAKFGDKFLTGLGLVLFVEKENDHYLLLQKSVEFRSHKNNNAFLKYDADGKAHCRNRGWDIISPYKEEEGETK